MWKPGMMTLPGLYHLDSSMLYDSREWYLQWKIIKDNGDSLQCLGGLYGTTGTNYSKEAFHSWYWTFYMMAYCLWEGTCPQDRVTLLKLLFYVCISGSFYSSKFPYGIFKDFSVHDPSSYSFLYPVLPPPPPLISPVYSFPFLSFLAFTELSF